jgi:6-phosphogluconolactonase
MGAQSKASHRGRRYGHQLTVRGLSLVADPGDPSRRDFLAASAIGLIGLARGSESPALRDEAHADGDLLYVGTYTESGRSEGIYLVRMDRRSGQLRRVGSVDAGANPSFIAIHPNGRVLYAVNELEKYKERATGAVSAFAIERVTGTLTRLNEQPSEGGAPCYVSVDQSGRVGLVANYVGGSIALLPIQPNGALAPAAHVARHTGRGPNAERQEAAHAHCVLADPSNRFVLAADLGVDRVFVYRVDLAGKSLRHVEGGDAVMSPGAGPRHIAFHPTLPLVFVANELNSTVATLRFDAERGALYPLATFSTVPAGWRGTNYPADIHVASSGRTLYVSNRGHNSIAVFSVAESTGALALEQVVSTDGDWPRNFSLDATGRWLLVANQRSDSVVVFARDPDNGRLTPTRQRIAIPSPVCLRFLAPSLPH